MRRGLQEAKPGISLAVRPDHEHASLEAMERVAEELGETHIGLRPAAFSLSLTAFLQPCWSAHILSCGGL